MWGKYEDFVKVNVEGTRSLLNLCEACGIPHFIYTSSPSVVADGTNLRGVDESYPYPVRWKAYYPETKALAEQDVLTRAKAGRIKALSLRPHLIFGPGDTSLTATVIDKAKRGKLVQVGDGKNIVDFTHIEDCITAHVLALKSLENGNASNGKPYFISQGDPVPMWEWIQRVLSYHNLQPPQRTISKDAAYAIASMSEYASTLLPWLGPPPFTRFLVSEMSTDHYFNISAARNDLGYSPPYSVWDRLAQTFEK